VIDLQDIYDEFSYGLKNADAIKTFLRVAYATWSLRPKYVVLAGEGSFDYRNYSGHDDCLVPPLMASAADHLYISDNMFADVTGNDGVPELAVGRIPAASAEELSGYIDKIIGYESATGSWTSRALFAADPIDAGGNFAATSDSVAAALPASVAVDRIYLDTMPAAAARAEFLSGLNDGRAYVNFFGHGGITLIGGASLLSIDSLGQLANGDRLPVLTAMTCMAGAFGFPGYDSLAESLVVMQGGGAIAVWSSSDQAYNEYSARLCAGFYEAVFTSGIKVLGDAILSAKKDYAETATRLEYLNFYNLIGDPALELK
jgi:hypothetical protein